MFVVRYICIPFIILILLLLLINIIIIIIIIQGQVLQGSQNAFCFAFVLSALMVSYRKHGTGNVILFVSLLVCLRVCLSVYGSACLLFFKSESLY